MHGVEILYPVQANAVFARLPHDVSERLQKRFRFYFWDEAAGDVRWMCAFDTTEDDVGPLRGRHSRRRWRTRRLSWSA
ncbi:hypothetical protein SALBM217S_06457 [Streptomyces griseoloalbus]